MLTNRFGFALALLLCLLAFLVGVQRISAGQASRNSNPVDLRFQLVGNEPIAGPDGRSVVNGWSVLVFKDRKAALCYAVFKQGADVSAGAKQPVPCPAQ